MGDPPTAVGKDLKARVEAEKVKASTRRVWCCYQADGSGFVLFGSELAALRYMAEHHMDGCKPVEYGVPLQEQIK